MVCSECLIVAIKTAENAAGENKDNILGTGSSGLCVPRLSKLMVGWMATEGSDPQHSPFFLAAALSRAAKSTRANPTQHLFLCKTLHGNKQDSPCRQQEVGQHSPTRGRERAYRITSEGPSTLLLCLCHPTESQTLSAFSLITPTAWTRTNSHKHTQAACYFACKKAQTTSWGGNLHSPHKQEKAGRQLPNSEVK